MINNYPPGAYKDSNAPYNQEYKEVDVELIFAKRCTFKVPTNLYNEEALKEEILNQVDILEGYELDDIKIW